jgi:hypothetical protein
MTNVTSVAHTAVPRSETVLETLPHVSEVILEALLAFRLRVVEREEHHQPHRDGDQRQGEGIVPT